MKKNVREKSRQNIAKVISLAMASITCFSVAACGGTEVGNEDNRNTIFISVFNGGYGRAWLDAIVSDYNTEHPENQYKISVRASKDEAATIKAQLESKSAVYDMFIISEPEQFMGTGLLEPITDVWDSKPAGSDRTIRQMMISEDEYADGYGDGKGEVYALPMVEGIFGFVYDHELFLKYGLLFNEQGTFITSATETLSKGKDGKANTYDDGHPETEAQWDAMVALATQKLGYAFNYTGKFASYLNDTYEMLAAQYDGVDKYMINYTYDGTYDFGDGKGETKITMENGYRVAEMKGHKFALEFMDKYLACKDTTLGITNPYTYPSSSTLSYSHEDAQTDFISFTAQNKKQKIGMLLEGAWWENEAKGFFDELEEANYSDYTFRTHDYRFMTLPKFDGQADDANVYSIADNMFLALKKQTDAEKSSICKDFMTYMLQPKYIQDYTVRTGGIRPYDVELTTEQKAGLSPFVKSSLELYYDKENNKFIKPALSRARSLPIRSGVARPGGTTGYWIVINGLYYMNADAYLSSMINSRKNNWADKLKAYNDYMALRG